MPDFGLVPHALLTPCRCVACNGHADPNGFVDLVADLPGYGRIYLCAGCVGMAAGGLGWIEPRVASELREGLRLSEDMRREQALELERANGRGGWRWHPGSGPITGSDGTLFTDVTCCPDCGGEKAPTSKRCRDCHTKTLHAPKAGATA